MIKIGEYNRLKVVRKAEFGYYLDAKTENSSDDILLPIKSALGKDIKIDDEIDVFVYKDSKDRIISTMNKPKATVGELAYLKVVDATRIGFFIDFGLERDILVPFKEIAYKLEVGRSYLFNIYLDKTQRLAATTYIDKKLNTTNVYEINEEVSGIVYGFQSNDSLMVAVDNMFKAVILRNEYYDQIKVGDSINARVKRYYDDGTLGLTLRKERLAEKEDVETLILNHLKFNKGFMKYNDKSSPEEIKEAFHTSKNAFKRALGGLMKKGLIEQNNEGTRLK